MNPRNTHRLLLTALIIVAAASRLVPHPWNVTPLGAIALLAGACLPRIWQSVGVILGVLFLSDVVLGLRSGSVFYPGMAFTYAAFAITAVMGVSLRRQRRPLPVAAMGMAGSMQFFLVSNLGVWLAGGIYPRTLDGLVKCYAAAVPFHRWQFVADVLFALIFFGLYGLAGRSQPARNTAPAL